MQTGVFSPSPAIRDRPQYPHLPHDTQADRTQDAQNNIGCSKWYQTYGKRGLTGGLMALWCTHSICIGFHCIPAGEGRNDVFSMIFTHWPVAPKFIIYDFACALAPYCWTREASFFKDTIFLVDPFHAAGHSSCSPACFLKTYAAHDNQLKLINPNAGECGNGVIARIRKPLSYMTQSHAILYTKTFLSLTNRATMLRHQAKAQKRKR